MRVVSHLAQLQARAEGGVRMRIVFWGASGECGTTSSMAAVAGYHALRRGGRSFCLQLKPGGDFELFFSPWEKRTAFKEESTYYALEGMDYLIRQEQRHRLDRDCIRESLLPLFDYRLFCLPCGMRKKTELYPLQSLALQRRVALCMERYADLLYIDAGHERGVLGDELVQSADVVVVNFSGVQKELEEFFSSPFRCRGRLVYLLADYDNEQVYNAANLHRIYRTRERDTCVLPANPLFAQACAHGRLEPFLKKIFRGRESQRDEQFTRELSRTARLITEVGADG